MDNFYYLCHRTIHNIMKSSTSLNNGYFLPSPEADNDADYLSFGTPEKSDDGVNDNI